MKRRKHLHTDFIKFMIEKYSKEPEDDSIEIPFVDEGENEEEVEIPEEEDEEIIEELLSEYKKLKRQYENNRIRYRR